MSGLQMTRRAMCAGAIAGMAGPALAISGERRRVFDVLRGESRIGEHVVSVRRDASGIVAQTDVDIAVKILGLTAYRYTLDYSERYDTEGRLVSLRSRANDDGDAGYATVGRNGYALEIDGSGYSGPAPISAVPTSYWRPTSLQASNWISTQTGLLMQVDVQPTVATSAPNGATAYRASDGERFDVNLFYDARREWIGISFDAKGERGMYRLREETGPLAV